MDALCIPFFTVFGQSCSVNGNFFMRMTKFVVRSFTEHVTPKPLNVTVNPVRNKKQAPFREKFQRLEQDERR